MAGCTESKKAVCRAQGKVCNPKSGRCKEAAKSVAAKKTKKAARPAMSPSTSLVQGAVLDAASPGVARSLMSKGYSAGLGGVGMDTLTEQTKKEVKKMAGPKPCKAGTVRNPQTGRCKATAAKPRKARTTRKAPRAVGGAINWSGAGVMSTRRIKSATSKAACGTACGPSARTRAPRIRDPETCKCLVVGGQAARKVVGCEPRMGKNGKFYETVAVKSASGSIRCVKAGGQAAKRDLGGAKACPAGKTLKTYTTTVPTADGGRRQVQATRCVKPTGTMKDCPANQVLVSVPGKGMARGYDVRRCVLPKTAEKKGFAVIKKGTMPVRHKVTQVTAQGRLAMSLGR